MSSPLEKNDKVWGLLVHLTALLALVRIPFAHILAPLLIWLFHNKTSPFIDRHGRESLNFQISMTIYGILFSFIIAIRPFLFFVLGIVDVVLVILAASQAYQGRDYQYPLSIPFIKQKKKE